MLPSHVLKKRGIKFLFALPPYYVSGGAQNYKCVASLFGIQQFGHVTSEKV